MCLSMRYAQTLQTLLFTPRTLPYSSACGVKRSGAPLTMDSLYTRPPLLTRKWTTWPIVLGAAAAAPEVVAAPEVAVDDEAIVAPVASV